MKQFAAALALFWVAAQANAFEEFGFKSGEPREAVIGRLEATGLKVQSEGESSATATDLESLLAVTVNFCGSRLFQVQKDLPPSFPRFAALVEKYGRAHGALFDVGARSPDPTQDPETASSSIWITWRLGADRVSVEYTSFPSNDQLSVLWEDTAVCAKDQ